MRGRDEAWWVRERSRRRRVPPVNPLTIAPGKIAAWWRADLGVTLRAGSFVTAWADQAGDNHWLQATEANQINLVSSDATFAGRPVMQSSTVAVARHMVLAAPPALTTLDLFVVLAADNDPGLSGLGTDTGHPLQSSSGFSAYPLNDGVVYETFGTTVQKVIGNPTLLLTTKHRYELISASGDMRAWVQNQAIFSTGTNTVGFDATWNLFRGGGSFSWLGRIAEIIVGNAILSAAEQTAMRVYLDGRYGL